MNKEVVKLLRSAYEEAYRDALRNEGVAEEDIINSMGCDYLDSKTSVVVWDLENANVEKTVRSQIDSMADEVYQKIITTLDTGAGVTITNVAVNLDVIGLFGFSVKSLNMDFKFNFGDEDDEETT